MPKEILNVFNHNQFSISAALQKENDIENKNIKLGELIGEGLHGKTYFDANNKNFILKKLYNLIHRHRTESCAREEVNCFNKYYGEGAAALIESGDTFYIRMYKVPGVTITSIKDKIFPLSAQERFQHMICDLGDKEIMHDDLHCNNILYDKETNTFYQIDFTNKYTEYYSGDNDTKDSLDDKIEMMYDWTLKRIINHTYY